MMPIYFANAGGQQRLPWLRKWAIEKSDAQVYPQTEL